MCPFPRRSGRLPLSHSLSWTRLHPSGSWTEAGKKEGVSATHRTFEGRRQQHVSLSQSALRVHGGDTDES